MAHFQTILLIFISLFSTSCASNTGTGVIAGVSAGAGIGGAIGGGGGALIGSAAGIIAGGLIGAGLDEQDRKTIERTSPRTVDRMERGDPLTLNDVIKLSQGGVSDDTIMNYIRNSGSAYQLTQAQVRRLQDAGVSQDVIQYMIDTGR